MQGGSGESFVVVVVAGQISVTKAEGISECSHQPGVYNLGVPCLSTRVLPLFRMKLLSFVSKRKQNETESEILSESIDIPILHAPVLDTRLPTYAYKISTPNTLP